MSSVVDGPFDNHILYKTLRAHGRPYLTPWWKRVLSFSDSLISLFIVGPLVIAYWKGTWNTMDKFPNVYLPLNSFIFGALIHCCFCLLREPFHEKFHSSHTSQLEDVSIVRKFSYFLIKRICTYIFSIGIIMHWYYFDIFERFSYSFYGIFHAFIKKRRGGWAIYDELTGNLFA